MLVAAILILFCLLALGLLTLLDRYDASVLKAQADRRGLQPRKLPYYDAFADRRQPAGSTPAAGRPDRRKVTA